MNAENKKENTIQPEIESVESPAEIESVESPEKKNKRLMNKTKKELIDIIFRKDDVEARLRKEKADIELDFNKAKDMCENKQYKINVLENNLNRFTKSNEELKTHRDALLDKIVIYENKLIKRRNTIIALSIVCIAILILGIIL